MSPGYEREKEANQDSAHIDLCPQQILRDRKEEEIQEEEIKRRSIRHGHGCHHNQQREGNTGSGGTRIR
jgi:hypothetical protein